MREVWLTVTGEQTDAEGRIDKNAVHCRALCENRDGAYIFSYTERDPGSGDVTDSRMLFSENLCRIDRNGAVTTCMRFEPQKEAECLYETDLGTFSIKLFTKRLAMRRVGENFHARVSYTLCFQGAEPVECAVTIKAEPV